MGSQEGPRMVILHCNDRTYGNAYLITFKVGPLRTHMHATSILPPLEAPAEGLFFNLLEFSHHIRFDVLHGWETVPLRHIFRVGNSQKSLGAKSGETVIGWWQVLLHNKEVWLGALSWCRNHCPCTGRRLLLESSGVQPSHSIWCPPEAQTVSQLLMLLFTHGFLYPKDVGDTFLQNVGSYKTHMPHIPENDSSLSPLSKPQVLHRMFIFTRH
jgi:hypothetical protein